MNPTGLVATHPENQTTLDRADAAYLEICLENNDYQYVEAERVYEALMVAWEYIIDSVSIKREDS